MRLYCLLFITGLILSACDDSRLYETNQDFNKRYWLISDKPSFEFTINDTLKKYNLYCNLRNTSRYPYSRIFIATSLKDSLGDELRKELITQDLFDRRTGEPFGSSALGDIYSHQFLIFKDFRFKKTGNYKVQFEQFMRSDTLREVLSVGLRVEESIQQP